MDQAPIPPKHDWNRIAATEEFRNLVRDKIRFIAPWTVFFIVYYFALPILVGYFPELMDRPVIGHVNVAYLFALSQFVMTWVLMVIYIRKAAQFDKREHAIVSKLEA